MKEIDELNERIKFYEEHQERKKGTQYYKIIDEILIELKSKVRLLKIINLNDIRNK